MQYKKIQNQVENSLPRSKKIKINPEDLTVLKNASLVALGIIGIVGFASIALIAPNLFSVLGKLAKFKSKHYGKKDKRETISRVFYYLKRKGYISFKEKPDGSIWVRLTKKGNKVHKTLTFQTLKIPKAKKWDKKWWQIAADIPTKEYRGAADLFRLKVKQMHLFPMQRSLWFYPYDPREEMEFLTKHFHIERFVTVMEINRMDLEDEKVLKKHFKKLNIL